VQFSERPFNIRDGESSVLPVRQRFFVAKTIEIDRHINIRAVEIRDKLFEQAAPVFPQDRAGTLSIFRRAIVGPGMDLEAAASLCAAVRKNVVWPPAFKISTAPDRDMLNMGKLESAIDPTAACPLRRRDRPIGMIVERNQNERLVELAQPKRTQIMVIARTVKRERRQVRAGLALRLEFAIKIFDDPWRRAEAELRAPLARIDYRQRQRGTSPGVVEIKMYRAGQRAIIAGRAVESACRFPLPREGSPLLRSDWDQSAALPRTA
jgi:hypothetical protein